MLVADVPNLAYVIGVPLASMVVAGVLSYLIWMALGKLQRS